MRKLFAWLILIPLAGCGDSFEKTPTDQLIVDMANEPVFAIILHDMDVEGTFFKEYKHQYRIVTERNEVPEERTTEWMRVPERFFNQHVNDLGMEIVTKNRDGKISKVAAPPGYSNYVGNSRYGEWRSHNGSSFWAFYGQYAFMSSMFHMMSRPVYRREYDTYHGSGYYGNRPYYGKAKDGSAKYGTNSSYARKSRPNFFARKQSRTGRSGRGSGRFRSRGGGFGK
ncbi:MAG: hypothetical protein AAGB22_09500 [Bacteroidota bacterium]